MERSVKLFAFTLVLLFLTTLTIAKEGFSLSSLLTGTGWGIGMTIALTSLDLFSRKYSLKAFNTLTLGIFFGSLLGFALMLLLKGIFSLSPIPSETALFFQFFLFFAALFIGVLMTFRKEKEIELHIPFIRLQPVHRKLNKMILLDPETLCDGRIVDFASSGLLDGKLLLSRPLFRELLSKEINVEEGSRSKQAQEHLSQLESLPHLSLQFTDEEMPQEEPKLLKLAHKMGHDILSFSAQNYNYSAKEGVRLIDLGQLAHLLKPVMNKGECFKIKIQRHGKEVKQGVGYLDDGTMVVVNGGGDHLGDTIPVKLISVKHTSQGRMIFCNAAVDAHRS